MIYFGPMGCRTGFYLLLKGRLRSEDAVEPVRDAFAFVRDFEGEIPGQAARDCGNYLDMNLSTAKYYARKYLAEFLDNPDPARMIYPQ